MLAQAGIQPGHYGCPGIQIMDSRFRGNDEISAQLAVKYVSVTADGSIGSRRLLTGQVEGQTHGHSDRITGRGMNAAQCRRSRMAPGFVIVLRFVEDLIGQIIHRKIEIHPAANPLHHAEVQYR